MAALCCAAAALSPATAGAQDGQAAPDAPDATAAGPTAAGPAAAPTATPETSSAAPPPPPAAEPAGGQPADWRNHRRTISDNTWRQNARRRSATAKDSDLLDLSHFLLEMRFGPYTPNVDDEFEGKTNSTYSAPPYEMMFGDDPLFYFGLELDWMPLHVPYVGSLGAAFGWGVVSASGNTRLEATPDTEAGSETSLTIYPMHVSAVFRVDGPLRKLQFPLVPYVKLGFGFGLWTASGPDGTSDSSGVVGEGSSYGLHLALGGALALNAFDQTAAVAMRQETGIRHAYIWGEWMNADLGGLGPDNPLLVGASTAVFGAAIDW